MNHSKICPVCAEGTLQSDEKMVNFQIGGAPIDIPQHSHWCGVCGTELATAEDTRFNARAYRAAEQKVAGRVTGDEIHALRKHLDITQEVAGKLFGGGPVAFCKYEKNDLAPSEPMDNLLWLIKKYPKLAADLAARHQIVIAIPDLSQAAGAAGFDISHKATKTASVPAPAPVVLGYGIISRSTVSSPRLPVASLSVNYSAATESPAAERRLAPAAAADRRATSYTAPVQLRDLSASPLSRLASLHAMEGLENIETSVALNISKEHWTCQRYLYPVAAQDERSATLSQNEQVNALTRSLVWQKPQSVHA